MAKEPMEAKKDNTAQGSMRKRRLEATEQASPKTSYLGFRLPEDELKAIEDAAGAVGESVSDYVRKAIAMRKDRNVRFVPVASFYYASPFMTVVDSKSAITEAPLNTSLDFSSSAPQTSSE